MLHPHPTFALQAFISTVYIFCGALQEVAKTGAHSVQALTFTLAQDTRPPPPGWPAGADPAGATYVYFQAAIRRASRA